MNSPNQQLISEIPLITSSPSENQIQELEDDNLVRTELAAVVERYVVDGAKYAGTGVCKKLLEMPRIREVVLRPGMSESGISTARSQNIEAVLGYTRGKVHIHQCQECKTQSKPFALCVVVDAIEKPQVERKKKVVAIASSSESAPSPSPSDPGPPLALSSI